MIPLVTASEMRAAERRFAEHGGDLRQLMEVAGTSVANRITSGNKILILAGPGNNGGDAMVCARRLQAQGLTVVIMNYKREPEDGFDFIHGPDDRSRLEMLRTTLETCEVVIDGLLGTGPRRPIEGHLAEIIATINQAGIRHRVAIDIPTGIDADTGSVESVAFSATHTVTLGIGKRGLWAYPGAQYAGQVEIVDLGLVEFAEDFTCFLTTRSDVAAMLPRRDPDSNKGKNGRVIVISGCHNFSGAPALVAMAAYRAGAGLVELGVPSRVQDRIAGNMLEPIFAPLKNSVDWIVPSDLPLISERMEKSAAFVVGPGLGNNAETVQSVRQLLVDHARGETPGVLDADGLNAVAGWDAWWNQAPRGLVVTPHPGEMARLMHSSVPEIQKDRFGAARAAALTWGIVVVLKGANTIIADATGVMAVNTTGGPNLATGGTGDVLSGTIAGFLAQGMSPREAAIAGVWVHGSAGDAVRNTFGDAGTLASDLLTHVAVERHKLTAGPN